MPLKNKFILYGVGLCLLGFFAVPFFSAKAITVSPIRLEFALDPGNITTGSIKVLNDSDSKELYLSVARFEPKDDESGEPRFVPGSQGLPSWIKLPQKIVATPNEFTEVPFTISVPIGTEPGGYFAAIFVTTTPEAAPGVVSIATDVGTLLFLRVNGTFPEGENIIEFATKNKQKLFTSLPVELYYRMTNVGADRVKPVGDLTIRNLFGLTSKVLSANPTEGSVLPGSKRKFETAWITGGGGVEAEHDLPTNLPKTFFQNVAWQWKHFAIGRYSATVHVTVNYDSSRSYEKSTAFWVFPWQLMTVITLGLIILFVRFRRGL